MINESVKAMPKLNRSAKAGKASHGYVHVVGASHMPATMIRQTVV